jgi:hypothetical protein
MYINKVIYRLNLTLYFVILNFESLKKNKKLRQKHIYKDILKPPHYLTGAACPDKTQYLSFHTTVTVDFPGREEKQKFSKSNKKETRLN